MPFYVQLKCIDAKFIFSRARHLGPTWGQNIVRLPFDGSTETFLTSATQTIRLFMYKFPFVIGTTV